MTRPTDIIQIHPFLKREWRAIQEHYERVGLTHAEQVVWDVSLERLSDYPGLQPSLFFFGPTENKASPNRDWQRVVEYVNDKNNFVALASHLRLDVPTTRCFHGKQWLAGIKHFSYPCYIKAAVSVAGKGIFRCANSTEVIQALAYFDEDVPIQVQADVGEAVFLNLQYQASDEGVERLLATEQILNGFTHQGNRFPASHAPWESVEPMAQWLWEKGIRGIFAFDVAVNDTTKGIRVMPIECNPRFNGASYPSGIATRLRLRHWIAKDFHTVQDRLSDIDLSDIEYNPNTSTGVVIVNWGVILVRKIGVLIAGTPGRQQELEAELLDRLKRT